MSEAEFPWPLSICLNLIKKEDSPHRKFLCALTKKMEEDFKSGESSKLDCFLNPTVLAEEIGKEISNRLTSRNIASILLVAFQASGLREGKGNDYWITTSHGQVRYHLRLTSDVLSKLKKFSKIKSGGSNEPLFLKF